MMDINLLSDDLAVRALSEVTARWFAERGLQAHAVLRETEGYAYRQNLPLPDWAFDQSLVTAESGEASRAALKTLLDAEDPEIRSWARTAMERVYRTRGQV